MLNAPTTPGLTGSYAWQPVVSYASPTPVEESSTYYNQAVAIWWVLDAPVISATTQTIATASNCGGGSFNQNGSILLEFTGAAALDVSAFAAGPPSSYPIGTSNLTTTNEDTVLVFATDFNFNSSFGAGTGYTLVNMGPSGYAIGGLQYQTNVSSGSISTAFSGSFTGPWVVVAISFYVPTPPVLTVSPLSMSFAAAQGGANPATQALTISNTGGGTLSWSLGASAPWITLSSTSGTGGASVQVGANIAGIGFGATTGTVTVVAAGASNSPQTVSVTLSISGGAAPSPSPTSGMFASASGQPNIFIYRQQAGPFFEPQWGNGLANFLVNVYAVAQAVLTRLSLFSGEWWESVLDGTPWFQEILGVGGATQQKLSLVLQNRVLGTPYVTGVSNVAVLIDTPNRTFSFSCTVQTAFGQTQITYTPQPSPQGIPN